MNNAWTLWFVSAELAVVAMVMANAALIFDVDLLGWMAVAAFAVSFGVMAACLIVHLREESQWTRLCQRLGAA